MKAIIIDDEERGRLSLRKKITSYCDNIQVIGEAENGKQGIQLITEKNPDIVFLDIEMPIMGGFEMMSLIPEQNFHLIFVTAYNQYAVKAIRYSAFDYLLKPVDIDDLKQAIRRIKQTTNKHTAEQLQTLKENLSTESAINKIAVPALDGLLFLDTENIIHVEADGNYTTVYLANNQTEITSRSLKEFEELLPTSTFFRCHHSHLVNLQSITRYVKGDGGQIELENGQTIPVSRRKKEAFLMKINRL